MNNKLLVVVDMQNDFIDGALGSDDARAIVPKVVDMIDSWDGRICFTLDTHFSNYLLTLEGRHVTKSHCISGERGHELHPEILAAKRRFIARTDKHETGLYGRCSCMSVCKSGFGSTDLANEMPLIMANPDEIVLIGLCTDVCVISNAILLRSAYPDTRIVVDASCCAGSTPHNHHIACAAMSNCLIEVINE